jgi:hypothetical protein
MPYYKPIFFGFLVLASAQILFVSSGTAEFAPAELCLISWGYGSDQLMMEATTVFDNATPDDSSDDVIIPGSGPSQAFVDKQGNLIFASNEFQQLKGFNSDGNLLFDFSIGGAQYDPGIFSGTVGEIYVDSSLLLYVLSFPYRNYVPAVDYSGKVVTRLYPFADSAEVRIDLLSWSFDGKILLHDSRQGWRAYATGDLRSRGTSGHPVNDWSFYAARSIPRDTLVFTDTVFYSKYENSDSLGVAPRPETSAVAYPGMKIYSASLINGMDGGKLYNFVRVGGYNTFQVWVMNFDYDVSETVRLGPVDEKLGWFILPFVDSHGNIYEFRCLDDGLHVIRWSKE